MAFVGIAKKLYDESRKPENQRRINDATPYVDPGCPTRPALRGLRPVARPGTVKSLRLRKLLKDDFPPALPAWGALNLRPSAEPWAHLRRVIDRLRRGAHGRCRRRTAAGLVRDLKRREHLCSIVNWLRNLAALF